MRATITEQLQRAAGLNSEAAASVAAAIVGALAEQLPAPDRAAFARHLPASQAQAARRASGVYCESLPLFYERVATLSGLPKARAVEATQVACAALYEFLDAETCAWLVARLPADLGALLSAQPRSSRPAEPPHGERRYPTLAEGRPGSAHPLSEAHPDRAHHASIARSDDPHADTKLASSPGPTQAREHETLAEGDPRPVRPLSSGRQ